MKNLINVTWIIFFILFTNSLSGQYQTYIDPDSRSLNTSSMVVGSTTGNFSVNNFGEATYAIPVFCSPGTNGMMPNISIVYNSNYIGGLLGTGWDIAGLSVIQRVQKNYYHENTVDGVDLQSTDRFALDSNRLIMINGTYGGNLSEYRTEIETFAKITANGIAGTGPSWFKVETKDGNTLEYGNTTDSKVEAYGSSTVYQWRISKITDKFGNYMKFTYNEVNGESYISSIDYTGFSTTQQPYNSLKFVYAQRTDNNFKYVGGSKVPNTKIISEIRMESEGSVAHKYQFKYFTDFLSRTYLNEVIEYGSDGSRFNSTIFGWPTTNHSFNTNNGFADGKKDVFYFGDFNADGRKDFIVTERKATYLPTDKWKLYYGASLIYEGLVGTGFGGIITGDTDGDGSDNIYIRNKITNTYNCNPHPCDLNTIQVSSQTTSTVGSLLVLPPPPSDTCWDICTTYENRYLAYRYDPYQGSVQRDTGSDIIIYNSPSELTTLIADLDGNGKDEIIFMDLNKNIHSINGIAISGNPPFFYTPNDVKILDFDGDGRKEILVIKDNNSNIYQYNNLTQQFISIYTSTSFPTKNHRIFIGDFNGDRKDDILFYLSSWSLKFSNGVGFVTSQNIPALRNYDPASSNLDNNYYIGDFNGDGMEDIAEIYKVSPTSRIRIFYSRGEIFSNEYTNTYSKAQINQDYFNMADFNGDGKDDLFYYDYSLATNQVNMCYFSYGPSIPRITKIYDGLNRKSKIEYGDINGTDSLYRWDSFSSIYPLVTLKGVFQAVKEVKLSTGVNSSSGIEIENSETYTYEGLRYHKQGKGLLGFALVKVNDSETELKTYKNYSFLPTNYYVYSSNILTTEPISIPVSQSVFTWSTIEYGDKRFFPYASNTNEYSYLTGNSIITSLIVDNYGNITSIQKNVNNGEATATTNLTNYTAYGNYGVPNRPHSASVTKTYENKTPATSTVNFDYYTNGEIFHEIKNPVTDKQTVLTYTYYPNGNLFSAVLSAQGLTSRSTTFSYDTKNRFVTTIQEPDGKSSLITYYSTTGNIKSVKGVDNLLTQFQYDGFGRLSKTITPEGHEIVSSLNWRTQTQNPGLFYSIETIPGRPDIVIYFDKIGRVVRGTQDGFGGLIIQDKEYNPDGTIAKVSWPYNAGETLRWTSYAYDSYERLKTINNNSLNTTYDYGEGFVSITDPSGKTKKTILNGLSNPVQVIEDDNTTITYDYNSFGSLSTIASNGNAISYFYDEFGFQDSVYNAYSGGVKYDHNAFGELVSQKDAKGQQVQFQYDILGRIQTLISPVGTTSYSYYPDGNGARQLSGISSPGNINESFLYDSLGRVNHYSKSILNEIQMNYSYGYDSYGNNTSMTYPSGLAIENVYDANGYLSEIKSTSDYSIWKLNSVKASGLPSVYTLGYNSLNLVKQFNYNSFENLSTITTGNWQQGYNFDDATGNLMSRTYKDLTNPASMLTETFLYDELDRLTSAQVAGLQSQTVTYSNAGNILSKSGIGNYTYDQSKANSLFSVENTGQIISSEQQLIYYNFLDKPDSITEGNYKYSMVYGADNQRIKSMLMDSTVVTQTKYYGPGYEKIITPDSTYENHYIASPYGLEAIIVRKDDNERLYYAETDHLGSLIGLISSAGVYVERHSFDPWGRRRNPADWSYNNIPAPDITDRGFTGHEHLDLFGIINMNGRMYDPITARFLNVDPVLQNPSNSQNFNSYSYCLNNPLRYIDPSGYNLQALKVAYYDIGGFHYRGGYYNLNEDGGWDYYDVGGGLTKDPNYGSFGQEQYTYNETANKYYNSSGKNVQFDEVLFYQLIKSVQETYRLEYHYSAVGKIDDEGIFSEWTVTNEWFTLHRSEILSVDYVLGSDGTRYAIQKSNAATIIGGTVPIPGMGIIGSYGKLAKITKGFKGAIQAHHLIETRFLKLFGLSKNKAPAVILDRATHQVYTKQLLNELPRGIEHSPTDVINAYNKVYSAEPMWQEIIKILLGY